MEFGAGLLANWEAERVSGGEGRSINSWQGIEGQLLKLTGCKVGWCLRLGT